MKKGNRQQVTGNRITDTVIQFAKIGNLWQITLNCHQQSQSSHEEHKGF
jgi:hypothetical protein